MTPQEHKFLGMALDALELMYACYKNPTWISYKQQEQKILEQTVDVITTIREVLSKPNPVQVSAFDFVEMTLEKEHLVGRPIIWAEWPNAEKA